MKKRIGIYAGAFNPVHAGHLAFALKAKHAARLDAVYFLPERQPRSKAGVEHYGHRCAMIDRAIRPYADVFLLELTELQFSTIKTLPKLKKLFAGDELFFLMGSDTALKLTNEYWDESQLNSFVDSAGLVIGLRAGHKAGDVQKVLTSAGSNMPKVQFIKTPQAKISSTKIRQALGHGLAAEGLLASVQRYALHQWLYIALPIE